MDILSLDFMPKNDNRITIEDVSDDSYNSTKTSKITKESEKKSLFNKISFAEPKTKKKNKCNFKNKNTKEFKKTTTYKNIDSKITNETKNILEKSFIDFQKSNEEYYANVLDFLNLIFCDNSKSILSINALKISLNEDVFFKYNEIIKKYKLKKDLFNLENFNMNDNYDYVTIAEIAKTLIKNLLEKLNYKLEIINYNGKKKFKIKNISQQI